MVPSMQCVPRGSGSDKAENSSMPLAADPKAICSDKTDPRILSGDVIKRIAADSAHIAPSGIRIIGAVFCHPLDLVGLDLPYSLVLDRSLFVGGINARNFSVRGDFRIDYAVLLRGLILTRAKVGGSVYSQGGFIANVILSDTSIGGSLHLLRSVFLQDARFIRTSVSGDLSINNSALSFFLLQSSRIGGALDLSDSETRCGYHVKASNIGYALAQRVGLGEFAGTAGDDAAAQTEYAWWRRRLQDSFIRQLLGSPATNARVESYRRQIGDEPVGDHLRGCWKSNPSPYAEFYFFDDHVDSTFCLRAFEWLAPATTPQPSLPMTIVALNGTHVVGNMIIDLWPQPDTIHEKVDSRKHKLEEIGVSAGSLIFDFTDSARPYFTYLDGLSFERVHTAGSTCEYQLDGAQVPDGGGGSASKFQPTGPAAGGSAPRAEPPGIADVERWLEKNDASSSQPYAAFVAALERAGVDATQLRVRRKTVELEERTKRWPDFAWPRVDQATFAPAFLARIADFANAAFQLLVGVVRAAAELVTIAFFWALLAVADHGLRPAKVVWWVAGVLLIFWWLFWRRLKIVGFGPKADPHSRPGPTELLGTPVNAPTPEVWPINLLFLFDRLIRSTTSGTRTSRLRDFTAAQQTPKRRVRHDYRSRSLTCNTYERNIRCSPRANWKRNASIVGCCCCEFWACASRYSCWPLSMP